MDLKGLSIYTLSLMGSNLLIRFCCKRDFEGIIIIIIIFFYGLNVIYDLRVFYLVGYNLPKIFWCKRDLEGLIIFMVFVFLCKLSAICDLGVGTSRGPNMKGGLPNTFECSVN